MYDFFTRPWLAPSEKSSSSINTHNTKTQSRLQHLSLLTTSAPERATEGMKQEKDSPSNQKEEYGVSTPHPTDEENGTSDLESQEEVALNNEINIEKSMASHLLESEDFLPKNDNPIATQKQGMFPIACDDTQKEIREFMVTSSRSNFSKEASKMSLSARPALERQVGMRNIQFRHIRVSQCNIDVDYFNGAHIHEEINPFSVSIKYDELEAMPDFHKSFRAQAQPGSCWDQFFKVLDGLKYIYSSILLVFCVVLVNAGIFARESNMDIHPAGSFIIFWFLILWLAMMEGGQGCIVGLKQIDKKLYAESHPISLKINETSHKGANTERFIVGRQFLVVLVVFLINLAGSAKPLADPLNLPTLVNNIFLTNGVALMISSIVLGNLTSQVNAAECMLDFINNYFMLFTTYVSLAIEYSGLLHSVYLIQYIFALMTKTPVESDEPPRSLLQNFVFWGKVTASTVLLFFSLAVTLEALFRSQSGIWEGTPVWASVILFFLFLCVVGLMEGMQIAAFSLMNMPEDELNKHSVAAANCALMFEGINLQAFLIGRQMFVASLMFIVAKIASISVEEGERNIFDVPDGFQVFLNTGLLGALVLTVIGSLAWRVIASAFPLPFMSNPLIYLIIRICLLLEMIGICSSVWILSKGTKALFKYKTDENYIPKDHTKNVEP